jgi:transcription termination factor Rho
MATPTDILNIAKQYHQVARHASILEPFKEGVLLLRAKDASYENIAATLNGNEIKVSAATIRKFCLRYGAEIKRLRV